MTAPAGAGKLRRIVAEHIGIYGGTFDPVHHGHLILARDAVEQLGLARLIFVPAALNPHKLTRQPAASGELRLQMLRAAVAGEPRFEVDDCELHRAGPSYTIDTVEAIRARLPAAASRDHLFYLIGADNLAELPRWHRIDALRALVTFTVFHRRVPSSPSLAANDLPTLDRVIDVSSTEIRNRVASGRSIRYLVPEGVAAVIDDHRLYRSPAVPNPPPAEESRHQP